MPPHEFDGQRYSDEIAWLKECYVHGAVIATACSGAMLLAEAGLLNGHDATTHWAYCDVMSRRYKAVRVHAQRAWSYRAMHSDSSWQGEARPGSILRCSLLRARAAWKLPCRWHD